MRYRDLIEAKNTESSEFRHWFGNSKVVSKRGAPMMLFHGTVDTFEMFKKDTIIWGSNSPKLAKAYGEMKAFYTLDQHPSIMPIYMRIEHPLYADLLPKNCSIAEFIKGVVKQGKPISRSKINRYYKIIGDGADHAGYKSTDTFPIHFFWYVTYMYFTNKGENAIFDMLRELGFDGIRFTENGHDTWGAFTPAQVKSKWNNGQWSDTELISEAISSRPYHLKTFVDKRTLEFTGILNTIRQAQQIIADNAEDGEKMLSTFLRYGANNDPAADMVYDVIYLASKRGFELNVGFDRLLDSLNTYRKNGREFLKYVLSTFEYIDPVEPRITPLGAILEKAEAGAEIYGYALSDEDNELQAALRLRDGLRLFIESVLRGLSIWKTMEPKLREVANASAAQNQYRPAHDEVETLYHTTAFATDIVENGFQSIKPEGRRGLGNFGSQPTISFTHSLKIAHDIYRALRELWMIVHGQLTIPQLKSWIEHEGMDWNEVIRIAGRSVEEPSTHPMFPSRLRNKNRDEYTSKEDAIALYKAWLTFTKIRSNPVFVNIDETANMLEGKDLSDIGILACSVDLKPDDEYLIGEWEFRLPPDRVRSIKRKI